MESEMKQNKIPLVVILGPTASGKTALSLRLAQALGAEIISVDSRQIYREIDIGSDKIPLERVVNADGSVSMCHAGVPHHMIDVADPDQVYSMSDFKEDAERVIQEIHARGKVPMLVGGTGLYIRAIVQGYSVPNVPPNPELRKKYAEIVETKGADALYAMLVERDPDAAKTMHANNVPYVVRALEIVEAQGKKVSKKAAEGGASPYNVFMLGIEWPRDKLCERIDTRVDIQMSRGLMEESRALLSKYNVNLPSMSSLGAKEFDPYFKGKITLEEVAKKLKSNTRRYAKRQMTWFKKEPDVYWISGEELERQPEKLTEQIIRDIMAAL